MKQMLLKLIYPAFVLVLLTASVITDGCNRSDQDSKNGFAELSLVGAWSAKIQFKEGPFAEVDDLEFMYVFNEGGTMTESSNYDAIPPVPPAYGIWRSIGGNTYEAKYRFFANREPDTSDHVAIGSGWLPAGSGTLVETIVVASDSKSFTSTIHYEAFDKSGNRTAGGGNATGKGISLEF